MENSAVEKIIKYCEKQKNMDVNSHRGAYLNIINFCEQQAKIMEKQNIIEARITAPLLPSIDKSIYLNEAEHYYNETFKSE
jgi:hypothetical protein